MVTYKVLLLTIGILLTPPSHPHPTPTHTHTHTHIPPHFTPAITQSTPWIMHGLRFNVFVVVRFNYIYIPRNYFTNTAAIIWLSAFRWVGRTSYGESSVTIVRKWHTRIQHNNYHYHKKTKQNKTYLLGYTVCFVNKLQFVASTFHTIDFVSSFFAISLHVNTLDHRPHGI